MTARARLKRRWHLGLVLLLNLLLWLTSCGSKEDPAEQQLPRVHSTRGSAIATSADGRIAVVANRGSGVITVLHLDPDAAVKSSVIKKIELDVGVAAGPWAAVLGANTDVGFVLLRGAHQVVRVKGLRGTPRIEGRVDVGSDPTAITITPSGERLFVANYGEGTLSVITTKDLRHRAKVDLNSTLVSSVTLGVEDTRPALAHPRALAITDDGDEDDSDETLFASEFFSQPLPGVPPDPEGHYLDVNRQGLLYTMSVRTGQLGAPIPISPVADTGFADATQDGVPLKQRLNTGCFPNQLSAIAVHRAHLFVSALCTSPRGPIGPKTPAGEPSSANFKTLLHPALFVVDVAKAREVREARILLTDKLTHLYEQDGPNDREAKADRMPLQVSDLAVRAVDTGIDLYATAYGADAVYRVRYATDGIPRGIGASGGRYIDLHPPDLRAGVLPTGIAVIDSESPRALVVNEFTQNVSVIDLTSAAGSGQINAGEVVAVHPTSDQTPTAVEQQSSSESRGRRLFATGLGSWSHEGQAWSSCESCHPDGQSDGVTWYFARGPRRTISTAGTYPDSDPSAPRRLLLWTAHIDEVHDIEAVVRGVSGGVGAILWAYATDATKDCRLIYDGAMPVGTATQPCTAQKGTTFRENGLNGSLASLVQDEACASDTEICDATPVHDWDDIDAFIRAVKSPRAPRELNPDDVARGADLFRQGRCAGCHGGPGFTISHQFYTPSYENSGRLLSAPAAVGVPEVGLLRERYYSVPEQMRRLNPPSGRAGGCAPFRYWEPSDQSDQTRHSYAHDPATLAADQIQCVLRAVGTFQDSTQGVTPAEAMPVLEVKQDMQTPARDNSGFNIPSLLGLSVGAPYFHAGNARSLEEVFDPVFAAHHQALAPSFLADPTTRADDVRRLVAYLLSIDEHTDPSEVPTPENGELDFDPRLCGESFPGTGDEMLRAASGACNFGAGGASSGGPPGPGPRAGGPGMGPPGPGPNCLRGDVCLCDPLNPQVCGIRSCQFDEALALFVCVDRQPSPPIGTGCDKSSPNTCGAGALCAMSLGPAVCDSSSCCQRICDVDDPNACGNSQCLPYEGIENSGMRRLGTCLPPPRAPPPTPGICNPFVDPKCPAGSHCTWDLPATGWQCLPPQPGNVAGTSCEFSRDCGSGHACVSATDYLPCQTARCCAPLCDLPGKVRGCMLGSCRMTTEWPQSEIGICSP